jgi:hypothetical protein
MKDARFTELVNLYIDRQISAQEASELEGEIRGNARRRAMYRQYCQMHRATKLVYESFRANAEGDSTPTKAPASIAVLESRRKRQTMQRWTLYAGGLAAAACVAITVARVGAVRSEDPVAPSMASQPVEAPSSAIASAPVNPSVPARQIRAGLVSLSSGVVTETDYAAAMATLRQEEQRLAVLTRENGQPAAPQSLFDDGVFTTRERVVPVQTMRPVNARQRNDRAAVEFTAFQFQR